MPFPLSSVAVFLFVGLASLPIAAQQTQSDEQKQALPAPASPSANDNQTRDTPQTRDLPADPNAPPHWFWTINWSNVALVIVAVWGTYVALGNLTALREQSAIARRQLALATEPRIYIDGVRAANFDFRKEPVFFVRIANAGPVQAENVRVSIEITHVNGGTTPAQPNPILIPANGSREYFFRSGFMLPANIAEFDGWNLKVQVTVTHDEQTKTECYKYNRWDGERPEGVPLFVPCDFDYRRHVAVAIGAGHLGMGGIGPLTPHVTPAPPSEETDQS